MCLALASAGPPAAGILDWGTMRHNPFVDVTKDHSADVADAIAAE